MCRVSCVIIPPPLFFYIDVLLRILFSTYSIHEASRFDRVSNINRETNYLTEWNQNTGSPVNKNRHSGYWHGGLVALDGSRDPARFLFFLFLSEGGIVGGISEFRALDGLVLGVLLHFLSCCSLTSKFFGVQKATRQHPIITFQLLC